MIKDLQINIILYKNECSEYIVTLKCQKQNTVILIGTRTEK